MEEDCEESEEDEDVILEEDIMEKDSGSEEERLKQSRQFRINLDQLFTAVYELNSKKDDPAVK